MKKLEGNLWHTSPACLGTFEVMRDKINELINEIEELKIQLSRIKKNRSDPRGRNPYKVSKKSNYKQ
jgi:hypothetical protein